MSTRNKEKCTKAYHNQIYQNITKKYLKLQDLNFKNCSIDRNKDMDDSRFLIRNNERKKTEINIFNIMGQKMSYQTKILHPQKIFFKNKNKTKRFQT